MARPCCFRLVMISEWQSGRRSPYDPRGHSRSLWLDFWWLNVAPKSRVPKICGVTINSAKFWRQPDSPVVTDRPTSHWLANWLTIGSRMVYRTLKHLCPIPHDCQISKEKHEIRLIKSPGIRQPRPRWSHFMTFAGLISRWITLIHRQGTVVSNDKDRSTEWTLWQRVIGSYANHPFSRLDNFFNTGWFASKIDMPLETRSCPESVDVPTNKISVQQLLAKGAPM